MGWLDRFFKPRRAAHERAILIYEAFDAKIRVYQAPTDPRWEFSERQREGEDFIVSVLACRYPAEPLYLVLLAKVYALDAPPDPPTQTDWRSVFSGVLKTIDGLVVEDAQQMTMRSMLPAVQVSLMGVNPEGHRIRIRERRAVSGRELFLVTAIGPEAVFDEQQNVIDQWFEDAAFVAVADGL